jgi:two-component system OmpR family response regulator
MVGMHRKILLVEQSSMLGKQICRGMEEDRYKVRWIQSSLSVYEVFDYFAPDLVLLDTGLPNGQSFHLCQQMRDRSDAYIVMISRSLDEKLKLLGFQQGADDYLIKPFSIAELRARVRAILGRQRAVSYDNFEEAQETLIFENLLIDPSSKEVWINSDPVNLTQQQFRLFYTIASDPNRIWCKQDLLRYAWGHVSADTRVINTHIYNIRKRIREVCNQELIQTVQGIGFKFSEGNHSA